MDTDLTTETESDSSEDGSDGDYVSLGSNTENNNAGNSSSQDNSVYNNPNVVKSEDDVFHGPSPVTRLLEGLSKVPLRDVLRRATVKFDIDSIIINSSNLISIINAVCQRALFNFKVIVNRLNATTSSRLSVTFEKSYPINNHSKNVHRLSLGSFPNIELATVQVANVTLYLHMFWLDPPYLPKVPYYQNKYILVITAALNLAKLKCMAMTDFDGNSFNMNPKLYREGRMSNIKCFADEMPPFTLSSSERIPVQKSLSIMFH